DHPRHLHSFPTRRSSDLACADSLDGLLNAEDPVGGKIVNHDNVSALERRSQTLLEVGQKDFSIHGSVNQHRRDYSGMTQACNERSEEHTSELQSPCNLVC